MTKRKFEYYDIRHLLKQYPDAKYYIVFGERSNGKTFSALDVALEYNFREGSQFAYIRRFGEDIRKKEMTNLFSGHIAAGRLKKIYKDHDYEGIDYSAGKFRLYQLTENEKIEYVETPIGYAFDLNAMEHYKSISFPNIKYIIFDEFLSRRGYLPNEFMLFTNTLSTLIRLRDDVKIIMLGNTVNKYSPYFSEMGLTHIKEQKQGTIDVYKYGSDSSLEVVVEYCKASSVGKKSDVYFAFDNPQLQMITKGSWEIAIYPKLQYKYKPKDVITQFFIEFDNELLHCDIIAQSNTAPYIFIHKKTTDIQNSDKDIIYGQEPSQKRNIRVGFSGRDKLSAFIRQCINENRIFYSENTVGEIFRNYVIWINNYSIKNL